MAPEFVDTNILVYAYNPDSSHKYERANALIAELWHEKRGAISIQVLQEFYSVGQKRFPSGVQDTLPALITDFDRWKPFSPGTRDVLAAIRIHKAYQISFWDAMIVHAAQSLECAILWSEDLNHGQQYLGVRVLNPFREQL